MKVVCSGRKVRRNARVKPRVCALVWDQFSNKKSDLWAFNDVYNEAASRHNYT